MHPELTRRAVTAVAIGCVAAIALTAGGMTLALFIFACFAALHWEWAGLTLPASRDRDRLALTISATALAALACHWLTPDGVGLAPDDRPELALGIAALAFGLWAGGRLWRRRKERRLRRSDLALYPLWIIWLAPAVAATLWLRQGYGIAAVVCPVAIVVAADIAAFFVGRRIGGPKLWRRVSPNKTWSGFIGGLAGGAAAGLVVEGVTEIEWTFAVLAAGVTVAAAGAMGDLAQSALKRRAGVKDSGGLLPGHGGAFDRLDGHVVALPLFALMIWRWGWPL